MATWAIFCKHNFWEFVLSKYKFQNPSNKIEYCWKIFWKPVYVNSIFLQIHFNKHKSFNSLWKIQSSPNNQALNLFLFDIPKLGKFWDVTELPPLKGISSPRFEEARKKIGLAYVEVGYHP
jgi:hypothetical protein